MNSALSKGEADDFEAWEEVASDGEVPSPRGNCGTGIIGDRFFIFGGSADWDQAANMCTTFKGDSFALSFGA